MNEQESINNGSGTPPSGGRGKRKRGSSLSVDGVKDDVRPKKIREEQRCQSSSGASAGGGPVGEKGSGRKKKARRPRRRHRQRAAGKKGPQENKSKLEPPPNEARGDANRRQRVESGRAGRAMAPRNTTQFLLDDRIARNQEPDGESGSVDGMRGSRERTFSGTASVDSEWSFSDGEGGSGDDDSDSNSFEREFEAEYESVHTERLEAMSKEELIRDYVNLEGQMQRSRVEWREMVGAVERLRDENYKLRRRLCECGLMPRPASAPPPLPPQVYAPSGPTDPSPSPEKGLEAEEETPADPVSLP